MARTSSSWVLLLLVVQQAQARQTQVEVEVGVGAASTDEEDAGVNKGPSSAAARLAELINDGSPVLVREHLSEAELEDALGVLEPTESGWRRRAGSFFELLRYSPPEHFNESELRPGLTESASFPVLFKTPLLITRTKGGLAATELAGRLTASKLREANPTVRPGRCASLALNYGPTPKREDSNDEWDLDLLPSSECGSRRGDRCRSTFATFHALSTRPFGLSTPTFDDGNLQLQTHGIRGAQLGALAKAFARPRGSVGAVYDHPFLHEKYFEASPSCEVPPQPALGFAGSLRGLPFHRPTQTTTRP